MKKPASRRVAPLAIDPSRLHEIQGAGVTAVGAGNVSIPDNNTTGVSANAGTVRRTQ